MSAWAIPALGCGAEHRGNVEVLKRVRPDPVFRNLSGNDHQRAAVGERIRDRGKRVGDRRPRGHDVGAEAARRQLSNMKM